MEFKHPLCHNNNDFHGYTVFPLEFNGTLIRFVTEKDAKSVIEKALNTLQVEYGTANLNRFLNNQREVEVYKLGLQFAATLFKEAGK